VAPWQTRASTTVYENAWIRVREDAVTRPDGRPGVYGVVEVRQPAVFVVPVTPQGEVVLVEVERYTTGQLSLEVPAGGSDGQDPLTAGRRELLEETGLVADEWQELGPVWSLNGVSRAPGHVLLARDVRPAPDGGAVAADGQAEEGITGVQRRTWPQVVGLLRSGAITDGESVAALMHAAVALGRLT